MTAECVSFALGALPTGQKGTKACIAAGFAGRRNISDTVIPNMCEDQDGKEAIYSTRVDQGSRREASNLPEAGVGLLNLDYMQQSWLLW